MKTILLTVALLAAAIISHAQCDPASYVAPDFAITVQNPGCPQQSEIKVVSASGGVGPFQYTLLPGNITNSTGLFTNIPAGNYQVQLKDACGTIRTRQATISPYTFTSSSTIIGLGCGNFEFNISCSATTTGLEYGYSTDGGRTIVWSTNPQIQLSLSPNTHVNLYVRDQCGNQAMSQQVVTKEMGGYIKILNERIECFEQEIYPEYYGFEAPKVCLYKSPQNTLVECKQAPPGGYSGGMETNFFDLPFGQDWYVIVEDGCYRDSMFFKDKTSAGGSEINPFAWHCNSFDMHVDGNNSDSVCIYNSVTNQLVACKPKQAPGTGTINPATGVPWPYGGAEFFNLPYGTYYAYIFDPCADTLLRLDTTVVYPRAFQARLHPVCTVNTTDVDSYFNPQSPLPHITTVIYPNGSIAATHISTQYHPPYYSVNYPTWSQQGTITVIQEDGCGRKDTSYLHQPMLLPIRSVQFKGGCPGIAGFSGGGDLILLGDQYAYGQPGNQVGIATVRIVKKDGVPVNIPSSQMIWNQSAQQREYHFTNLTTGTYIIESDIGCYHFKIYDTAVVKPYTYPTQDQPHIYQCGSNSYVFRDTVTGGLAPYTYEILATVPNLSNLLTGAQNSNTFFIPPGTNLSAITMRVVDACGNSNIKVFPVNHLGSCDPLVTINPLQTNSIANKAIKLYPNPSHKDFVIDISQRQKQDYRIEVFNSVAVRVYTQVVKDVDRRTITVSQPFTKGIYSVVITSLKTGQSSVHKQVIL